MGLAWESRLDVALALEPLGKGELALRCYQGVRMDLGYLVDRFDDPRFPRFEKVTAVYWLQRACEECVRRQPEDAGAARELQRVRDLRAQHNLPDAASTPRFGPIAKTYLDKTPYLALIIGELENNYRQDRQDECVSAVCQRFGCPSRDVDFYLSAIGSYQARSILAGVTMMYDDAHLEVFAAIEHLYGRKDS